MLKNLKINENLHTEIRRLAGTSRYNMQEITEKLLLLGLNEIKKECQNQEQIVISQQHQQTQGADYESQYQDDLKFLDQ